MTNKEYTKNPVFAKACELAKTKPTSRQASKYRMGKGSAITYKAVAKTLIKEK